MDIIRRNQRIKLIATFSLFALLIVLALIVSLLGSRRDHQVSKPSKLLLVSLDGFHYRYLDQYPNETQFLRHHFADQGVLAEKGMRSVFATKTFAIHWTLATGLYEESHGILGNRFYDPLFNQTFDCMRVNESKWFDGEPIWSTAQKQGLTVGVSQWMGSAVRFTDDRQAPKLLDPHETCHSAPHLMPKLDIVHDYLFNKGADFAMLYFNEPDSSGHWYGASSPGVGDALAAIDAALQTFVNKLPNENINIIILSGKLIFGIFGLCAK